MLILMYVINRVKAGKFTEIHVNFVTEHNLSDGKSKGLTEAFNRMERFRGAI